MALSFILGPPGSGKTTKCLEDISEKGAGPGLFYIVPEQSSLQAERMLIARSPGNAVMGAQAISFGRLAYYVFARVGGAPVKHLNDVGKHMLLRKILQECELSFYARAVKMPGFIENLSQTITEFSQYDVPAHELEARNGISDKMTDLAEILRHWRENIAGRFLVTGETLNLLVEMISSCDQSSPIKGGVFWIDGFWDFTPQELNVIGKLMTVADDITVTLTMDADTEGSPLDFFYATKRTLRKLRGLANDLGVAVNPPTMLNTAYRKPAAAIQIPVQDKAAELVRAAEWIVRNVHEEKRWRFRDIAVLCGDLNGYEKLARNIFEPYGIPLFVDSKMGILSHPLTELIRAAVDVLVWDWQYEGVFRILKTGFTPLPMEEIDRLENHVLARGIKGWKWRVLWNQNDSYDSDMEALRLRVLNMMDPLSGDGGTVAGYSRKIYDWLYSLGVPDTLRELIEEGDQEQKRWHRQIWPRIGEVFDKLVEILGEDKVTAKEFGEILEAGFKSADLGMIPPSLDQVVMGDIGRSRYPEIKSLWVLGANDGQLPPPVGQSSLITEDERAALRKSGLELAPDLPRQVSDSMLALYGALCQPSEELVLSYSQVGSDGKSLRPSPAFGMIGKWFRLERDQPVRDSDRLDSDRTPAIEPEIIPPLSEQSALLIYGEKFQTAASRLEAYVQCPFAYFLNYNLRARERAIYQVRALDLGILYHEVLERATGELTRDEAWHRVKYEDLAGMVHSYAEAVVPGAEDHVLRSSARNMYILQRVKDICTVSLWALCEQYRRGEYQTAGIEARVREFLIPLDDIKNREMVVSGRIDRVDIFDDFVKIIDYKSGGTRFDLSEVQAGAQLQLMLYMNALLKDPSAKPGGVFYFNIDSPILAVDEVLSPEERDARLLREFRMSGLVLADKDNIAGMDKGIKISGDSPVIPVSLNKDGSYSKSSSVASAEEFERLCKEVEGQVKGIGQRMASGAIAPNPYVKGDLSACRYCKFTAVCGFNRPTSL